MENATRRRLIRWIARIATALMLVGLGPSSNVEAQPSKPKSRPAPAKSASDATPGGAEDYVSEGGNFRIRLPGTPKLTEQVVKSPKGPITQKIVMYQSPEKFLYGVIYTDLKDSDVRSSNPDTMLDGGVRGMAATAQWSVKSRKPISLGIHPGREVGFDVSGPERGTGLARLYLVGNRLYQVIMIGPKAKVRLDDFQARQDSFELIRDVPAIAKVAAQARQPNEPRRNESGRTGVTPSPRPQTENNEQTLEAGSVEGPDPAKPAEETIEADYSLSRLSDRPDQREVFRELSANGGILAGVRVTYVQAFGKANIGSIQPIFQTGRTYVPGIQHGKPAGPTTTVMARPGYAVGGVNTRTGLNLDAFQVVFMRFKDGRLDPNDSYISPWLGDPKGGGLKAVSGEGKLVVGIYGRNSEREIRGLGLIVAE